METKPSFISKVHQMAEQGEATGNYLVKQERQLRRDLNAWGRQGRTYESLAKLPVVISGVIAIGMAGVTYKTFADISGTIARLTRPRS